MDINKIIFTRTGAAKKVEIVNNLTEAELLNIQPPTIVRMIKEAGTRLYSSRDKELRFSFDRKPGNDWNSLIEGVRNNKVNLRIDFYIQYQNTDTNLSASLSYFLKSEDYRGSIVRDDRCGNPRSYYFTYSSADKAQFVKSLLLEYLHRKYKDKL